MDQHVAIVGLLEAIVDRPLFNPRIHQHVHNLVDAHGVVGVNVVRPPFYARGLLGAVVAKGIVEVFAPSQTAGVEIQIVRHNPEAVGRRINVAVFFIHLKYHTKKLAAGR